jgi:hypothetical protein
MDEQNAPRAQDRIDGARSALDRVRQRARQDRNARFTTLLHHITVDRLRDAYLTLQKRAAPGVDGVTWEQHRENLEENLLDLHTRLHRGAYRARPSRRAHRVRCARRRYPAKEGELGARCRPPWLFRRHRPRVAGEVRRAPYRGSEGPAPHPEMAERRGGSHPPACCIPGLTSASTFEPEARAQCGSSARWDPSGGRPEPDGAKGRPYRNLRFNRSRRARSSSVPPGFVAAAQDRGFSTVAGPRRRRRSRSVPRRDAGAQRRDRRQHRWRR